MASLLRVRSYREDFQMELPPTMEAELLSTDAWRRHWHRWFAWRPVLVFSSRLGTRRLLWLEYLERRWTEGITSGLGPRWIYRRMRV